MCTTKRFLFTAFIVFLTGCGGGSSNSGSGSSASENNAEMTTEQSADFSGTYKGTVTATATSLHGAGTESATETGKITIVIKSNGTITITDETGDSDSGTVTGNTFRVKSV